MADSNETNLAKHLLDDFVTTLSDDILDETLDKLELVSLVAKMDKLARLRRRIKNEYHEPDFAQSSLDPEKDKERRDKLLEEFLNT